MTSVATVRAAFAFEPLLCKGEAPMPKGQKAPMERLKAVVLGWLGEQLPKAIAWGEAQLGPAAKLMAGCVSNEALRKQFALDLVGAWLAKSSEPDFDAGDIFDDLAGELVAAAFAGTEDVATSVGIDLTTAPALAEQYARERAAEMVGKKLVAGILVDNPNAQFAISDTLRKVVRDTVTQAISNGWSPQELTSALQSEFGDWRAETIARYETGMAYGNAAAEGYRELGVDYLEIVDGPGCLPDGHDDGASAPDGEPGEIQDDSEANGQVWTVDQYQEHLLGHPRCVRSAVPAAASVEQGDQS